MTVTSSEAQQLIQLAKEAVRVEVLNWQRDVRYDEAIVSVGEPKGVQFVLSFKRNSFEIKVHLRAKSRNIQLARVDDQRQHINPDGTRIIGPHIHWFREGYENLEWAESIDWYDSQKPLDTNGTYLRAKQLN